MSKAKMFQRAHAAIMKDLDERLEALAVNTFGPADSHPADQYSPPERPVKVRCNHCGERYLSNKMRREYRPRMQFLVVGMLAEEVQELEPLWWCKNSDCEGAGYGFDLRRVEKAVRS